MIRRYFEEEMRYLHEAGKAFAEAHPETAGYLNVDSVTDRDPYVERLFEGFAFLSGRIHERLDDELPELTESLFQLLYPQFLKPVPSASVVEFAPRRGLVQTTTTLNRGTEVLSDPVGEERSQCRFQTTQPVVLHPVRLTDAVLQWKRADASSVRLSFEVERGVDFRKLDVKSLRLYFHADSAIASTMHLFFTRHVRGIELSGGEGPSAFLQGQEWVRPVGLEADEAFLDYGPNSFSGHRLLHEYLCFRRKFWFVDVMGIDRLKKHESVTTFHVDVVFDGAYPEDRRFKKENIRLYCAPVVNLFSASSEPVHVDGMTWEYRVIPDVRQRQSVEAYDVEEVVGVEDATGRRHSYKPFFAFRHATSDANRRFYAVSRRSGARDHPEIYIRLCDETYEALSDLPAETLSLKLRCTNGALPRAELREGMIRTLAHDVPQVVTPANLTQPTLILYPPSEKHKNYFWKLISHWSYNYLSVASREAVTGLLELYNWSETEANRKRTAGIASVDWKPRDMLVRGAVLRGAEVEVKIQERHFSDEGDLNLFGLVLSEFFSMYATINSFINLTIVLTPSGKRYEWKPRTGTRPLL